MNPTDVDRLISSNQGLVVHMAKKHRESVFERCHTQISLAGLIAAGKIGLVEAAKRFNPAKGKFSTYAASWITKYLFKARSDGTGAVSLDAPIGKASNAPGHWRTTFDVVPDKNARSAQELLSAKERSDTLEACRSMIAGAGLDSRETEIIFQRYGMADGELKTQKQIAKKLGVTRVRVTQLEKIAREKIAKHVRKLTA
jgi:RNA polymerase sporulation-specific sigma factor